MFKNKKALRLVSVVLTLAAIALGTVTTVWGYAPVNDGTITFAGSTTVFPLIEGALPTFMADYDGTLAGFASLPTAFETNPVQGSSDGQRKLFHGAVGFTPGGNCGSAPASRVEIAMSSSQMRTTVCTDGGGRAWGLANVDEHAVARDGVVIIVNSNQSAAPANIALTQIKYIWEGSDTGTPTAGGYDLWSGMVAYARETASGTREVLLQKAGIVDATERNFIDNVQLPRMPRMLGNPDMCAAIQGNINGIGYLGFGFCDPDATGACQACAGTRALRIDNVAPTITTIVNGSYPLSRLLYLYTLKPDLNPVWSGNNGDARGIATFLAWIKSPIGQKFVADAGFIPVRAPLHDLNRNGVTNAGDVVALGLYWGNPFRWK